MPLPKYVQEAFDKKVPSDIDSIIAEAAKTHNVEPELIRAQIDVESARKPTAVSKKGACGLMQLMPETAKEMGVKDITDPYENIMGGTKYFKQMFDKFDGDIELALAAYNAGPGNVKKHGGIPPFEETQKYVPKVLNKYNQYKKTKETSVAELPVTEPLMSQTKGLPSYVKEAIIKEQPRQPKEEKLEEEEWDPEWMREHPNLAGLYGAGKGILEQAIVPSIEATGMIIGSVGSPILGTALGYGIARQLGDDLISTYKRLGGYDPEYGTIGEEMLQSAADVGTVLILGKTMDMGAKAAPIVENYLFKTLPKRLYGSAIKTPMSKKWIQTLPDEIVSKQTAAIEEGLRSRIPPGKYGFSKVKGLEKEVSGYIDDVTKILSEDPSKIIDRELVLKKGLEKAYIKAASSSDPKGAKIIVNAIAERFRAHSSHLTPEKANQIKRQLYKELKYGFTEPSAIKAQMDSVGKKGVAREIMLNLEQIYPDLAKLNAIDAARISLIEAIERAYAKEAQKNIVPLGAKVLMRPKTWPLAIWESTIGHPQIKARLAFTLHKANPVKYPDLPTKFTSPIKPKVESPKVESPTSCFIINPPSGLTSGLSKGTYTSEQLSKMLKSKDVIQVDTALQNIIDKRTALHNAERERVITVNKMLETFKKGGKK